MENKSFVELGQVDKQEFNLGTIKVVTTPTTQLEVEPKTEEQVFESVDNVNFDKVTVGAVTSKIDNNIKPENILKDVNILGTVGTLETGRGKLQVKAVGPTKSHQVVKPDKDYYGLESVTVAAIPSEYIVPTGTKNITENGVEDVAEYKNVAVNVQPSLQEKNVEPNRQMQSVVADSSYYGLKKVNVGAIPEKYVIPEGTLDINDNGVVDVTNYKNVSVEVETLDVSDTTATPNDVLSGKEFYNADGVKVSGNIGTYAGGTEVTPITQEQVLNTKNKYNDNDIKIKAVDSSIDSNIKAENIKEDVTILGIKGTLKTGSDVVLTEADATESDVLAGKKFYGNSAVVKTGTMATYDGNVEVVPSRNQQTLSTQNKYNTKDITIGAVDSSIDENITPTNIRAGVTILGVEGNLEADKPNQSKTVKPTTNEQTVVADTGYELEKVTVEAVVPSDYYKDEEVANVTPTTESQTITPSENKVFSSVNVSAVDSTIDSNIQAENIKKDVTILGVTGTLEESAGGGSGEDTETLKGVLDGSLTELDTTNLGITKIDQYKFYNNTTLTSANLTNITEVGADAFFNNTNLTNANLTNIIEIGDAAFSSCTKLVNLTLNPVINNVGKRAFTGCALKSELNVVFNGSIGSEAFMNNPYVPKVIFTGSPTNIGSYAFYNLGNNRSNPQDNINTYDFKNGTFTSLSNYTFTNAKYSVIRLSKTLKTIGASEFSSCTNSDIYFYGETPPSVSNSNSFSNIGTATKIFVPYTSINSYKTTTNFTTVATYIKGFAPENTFVAGEELPLYDTNGYGLTWYSDKTLTTVITTMPDTQQEIYCTAGTEIVAYKFDVSSYNANVTATDGVKTYKKGDMIANGTTLTINATGIDGNTEKYYFTVNDVDFTSGGTHTVTDADVVVACIYYDGINLPFTASFADASWEEIKRVSDAGVIKYVWELGSTKEITWTNTSYQQVAATVRLIDGKQNRYEKADGSGYTNSVFEFVHLATQIGYGGYNSITDTTLKNFYNNFQEDLKAVVSEALIPTALLYSAATITYKSHYVFLPSTIELSNSNTNTWAGQGSVFEWYDGKSNEARIKTTSTGKAISYWTRSPYSSQSSYWMSINTSGAISSSSRTSSLYTPICFAI